MSELWKQWTGRNVAGKFTLESYLGGSDHSAVFLTTQSTASGSDKAAIKLIAADRFAADSGAEKQLARWNSIREWNHPNLIRIFEAGRCDLDGTQLLYVVEEYAEENLAQILPERALTAEETRGMLPPVLQALKFVHNKGFVHGSIQPANILAIGDDVKLSTDSLHVAGEKVDPAGAPRAIDPPEAGLSTAGDVWQLAMTLVEVLTQHLPVWDRARPMAPAISRAVAEPFREIAGRSLQVDASKRWTLAQISDCLEGKRPAARLVESVPAVSAPVVSSPVTAGPRKPTSKWPYGVGLAAVVAIAVFLIARPKPAGPPADVQSTETQQSGAAENTNPTRASTADDPRGAPANADQSGVVHKEIPEVSAAARHTIQGKIVVRVKVKVDDAGNVEVVKFDSGRASKYFKRLALDSARDWKFVPAQGGEAGAREWKLQFAFSRAKTEAFAVPSKR